MTVSVWAAYVPSGRLPSDFMCPVNGLLIKGFKLTKCIITKIFMIMSIGEIRHVEHKLSEISAEGFCFEMVGMGYQFEKMKD